MNKKLIMLTAVLAAAMMFSSCGKAKKDADTAEPSKSQADTNETTQNNEEKADGESGGSADENKSTEPTDKAQQDGEAKNDSGADSGIGMSADEFADLVDKFNNTQDEQEKEQAREKIQAILEKAEQQ